MTSHSALEEILDHANTDQPLVRLVIVKTRGSVPREPGAAMLVSRNRASGTIGGGQLEFEAITYARKLIERIQPCDWFRELRIWPLGPALGQCCGGTVEVLFELYGEKELAGIAALNTRFGTKDNAHGLFIHPAHSGVPVSVCTSLQDDHDLPSPPVGIIGDMLNGAGSSGAKLVTQTGSDHSYFIEPLASPVTPLFIFGAGHVGRAIVKILTDVEFDIHWVDTHEERFPPGAFDNVHRIVARDPTLIARAAPDGAFHIVLTYSHTLDLAICQTLLIKPVFGFLGLIGSQTKHARFLKRLRAGGVSEAALSRLTCPIGISQLRGKTPATIAISIAAQLIEYQERLRDQIGSNAWKSDGKSQQMPA